MLVLFDDKNVLLWIVAISKPGLYYFLEDLCLDF